MNQTKKDDFRQLIINAAQLPENSKCIDCGAPCPTWTSCRLGLYMCLNCAGRHRSYGAAISFVKASDIDRWSEELCGITLAGGNKKFEEFMRTKKLNKPYQYNNPQLEKILEEYRQKLVDDSSNSEIQKVMHDYRKNNMSESQQTPQPNPNTLKPKQTEIQVQNEVESRKVKQEFEVKANAEIEDEKEEFEEEKPQKQIVEEPLFIKRNVQLKDDSSSKKSTGRKPLGKITKLQ